MTDLSKNISGSGNLDIEKAIRMMVRIRTAETFIRDTFWN